MKPHLSQIVDAGSLVFVSGQLGFDAEGVIGGDITDQTRRTLDNLCERLRQEGLSLSDVVKTTVWIVSRDDFAAFNHAYAAAFGDHAPARSTVVSALARPEALVEIEAVARRPVKVEAA